MELFGDTYEYNFFFGLIRKWAIVAVRYFFHKYSLIHKFTSKNDQVYLINVSSFNTNWTIYLFVYDYNNELRISARRHNFCFIDSTISAFVNPFQLHFATCCLFTKDFYFVCNNCCCYKVVYVYLKMPVRYGKAGTKGRVASHMRACVNAFQFHRNIARTLCKFYTPTEKIRCHARLAYDPWVSSTSEEKIYYTYQSKKVEVSVFKDLLLHWASTKRGSMKSLLTKRSYFSESLNVMHERCSIRSALRG